RLAAGDGHHGRAALLDGGQTLLDAQVLAEHVAGILDLAAAGAGQVAAEERLQHQDQRVALAAADSLSEDIRRHRPHPGNGNAHACCFSRPSPSAGRWETLHSASAVARCTVVPTITSIHSPIHAVTARLKPNTA